MVSCLLLMHASHIGLGRENGRNVTACGMSLADEHVEAHLFAADPSSATCPSCIAVRDAERRSDGATAPTDARAFASWFFEEVLNREDLVLLAKATHPDLAPRLPPARLARLHALFPNWHARIHETIAQEKSILVRYDVDFTDPLNLLGPDRAAAGEDQAVILRVEGPILTDVTAIVDDFALWSRSDRRPERQPSQEPAFP